MKNKKIILPIIICFFIFCINSNKSNSEFPPLKFRIDPNWVSEYISIDIIINIFTTYVSVTSRTVTVQK